MILRVEENHVVINYYSWNSSFCERVEKKSARLQPYLTTILDKVMPLYWFHVVGNNYSYNRSGR